MYLTQFFYINSDETKVFCSNKFCISPKRTIIYKKLLNLLICDKNIIGIGYQYNVATKGLTVTHKKLK
jgi:hypothetical protein